MIKIVKVNTNGKIELTEKELEEMLDQAKKEGYIAGKYDGYVLGFQYGMQGYKVAKNPVRIEGDKTPGLSPFTPVTCHDDKNSELNEAVTHVSDMLKGATTAQLFQRPDCFASLREEVRK